jgi:glycosyltransferase involved in cell wall biosynthesis
MTPAVSVVIAAKDYGHFLADALASVQRQTFTDWECVLVDDGSRDHSTAVAETFLGDPRFRLIRSDNLGQVRAKNLGLRLSRAELVAFLDGDDVWLPSKLDRQVRLLQTEPGLGAVFTRRFLIDPTGAIIPSEHSPFPRGMVFDDVLLNNFVCFSSTMVRRSAIEHVGAFDNRLELAIDYDLWLRVARHYPFDFIDEALVKYRTGHGNLSKRITERITTVFSAMRRSLIRRQAGENLPDNVQREAWGSTCRTMGYVLRDVAPARALAWYGRAARHDRRWGATIRAFAACLKTWIGRTRRHRHESKVPRPQREQRGHMLQPNAQS